MIYTPFIWPLIFAIGIDAGLALYASRYRRAPVALPLQFLMWSGVLTAFLYMGEITYTAISAKIFFSQLRFIPASVLAPICLVLVLEYLGMAEWLSRPRLLLLYAIPAITALLSLTGAYHNLFRYGFQIHADSPVAGLVFERGAWWFVYYSYTLVMVAIAVVLLAGALRGSVANRPRPRNTFLILLAIVSGVLVDILYVMDLTPVHGYYWTPAVFALTGWLFSWAVFSGHMLDFTPVARDTVLENMSGLVIVLDNERRILDFNRAAQAACGLSKAATGRLPEQALSSEWAAALAAPPDGAQAKSLSYNGQRVYEITRTPIQDRRGRRLGTLFLFHDITERISMEGALRQAHDLLEQRVAERTLELSETNFQLQKEIDERQKAEEALRQSEQRFRVITSSTPDHIVVQDRELRYTLVVNPQLGLTQADMLGKTDFDFLQPDEAARLTEAKKRVLETGRPLHYWTSLISRTGKEEFFDGTYIPKFDAQGQVDELIGYFRNVTEQKQAEQALRDSERANLEMLEFNKKILSTSSVGILTYHESGQCTFANQAAAGITDAEVERLLEQNFHQLHTWQVTGLYQAALEALKTGQEQQLEIQSRTTYGRETWTNFSFSSFYVKGEKQLLVFMQDITKRKQAERALGASEEKYRQLVETAHDGIAFLDKERRITYHNSRLEEITGYPAEALIGQSAIDFIFAEDLAEQEAARVRREQGLSERYERKMRHADGHAVCLQISASPLIGTNGQIIGSFVMCNDITERKQAEQELQNANQSLRLVLQASNAGTWDWDIVHQIFLWSEEFSKLLGMPATVKPGLEAWTKVVYPPDQDMLIQQIQASIIEKKELVIEYRIVLADRQIRWVRSIGKTYYEGDMPVRMAGLCLDITERKLVEEALRRSNAYNRSLIEASLDPFVTLGPNRKIIDANSAAELATGYSRQEMIGTQYDSYFNDWNTAHQVFHQALNEGSVRDYELELKHRDGHSTPVLFNASLYRDESGQMGGLFVAARDITRRKQIEAAEREQRQLAEALRDTSVALTRSLNLDQVLDQVIASVGLVVPSDSVSFLLVESREPGHTQVRFTRQRGFSLDEPGESLLGVRFTLEQTANFRWMAETGKSLVIEQAQNYPGWVDFPQCRWIRSLVGAPVRIKEETIGFIDLASAKPAFFTGEHAKRLEAFAAQAAIAIENARLYEEVLAGRERLQAISVRLVQVQESERRRLARELHDEIGQELTGLKFSLEVGTGHLGVTGGKPDALRIQLRQARRQVSELIAKTRELSLALRPAMLDDLGLLPALIWHIDRYQEQTGLRVQFQASDLEGRRYPAELETAVYRIVQEALTNVARHAQVKQAAVSIWVETVGGIADPVHQPGKDAGGIADPAYNLHVSVADRGVGFDLPAVRRSGEGSGLAGMQERVTLLGGRLTIETLPGTGTHLTAVFPLSFLKPDSFAKE